MTREQEIEARLAAATPGPWRVVGTGTPHRGRVLVEELGRAIETIAETYCGAYEGHGAANADLIANAPADIRYLLDEVARLRADVERHREREIDSIAGMPR